MARITIAFWDHPRSRGVYYGAKLMVMKNARIIPARAGFTAALQRVLRRAQDHPRSRGVYRDFMRKPLADPGSSPLARGLRNGASLDYQRRRIIPARAGFTPGFVVGVCR